MRVQETVAEEKGFDLLVMGRPEGPGCYCYVNTLLRNIIGNMTKHYDFVVIDNAAGMEHISRRTMREMTALILVADYSVMGVRAAKKIYDLAIQMGIKLGSAYLVTNMAKGPISRLAPEIKKTGLEVAGEMPYSERIVEWNINERPFTDFSDKAIDAAVERMLDLITRESHAGRTSKGKV